jgi:predicted RNase H-like HicB family nuclease
MGKIIINVDWSDNFAAAPANENIACVSTGHTLDELKKNMLEALEFHIQGMREDGEAIPAEFEGALDIEWHLTTAALLHHVEKLIPKAAIAKVTGINQQQLTHYASGYRKPRPEMQKRILDGIHTVGKELIAIS